MCSSDQLYNMNKTRVASENIVVMVLAVPPTNSCTPADNRFEGSHGARIGSTVGGLPTFSFPRLDYSGEWLCIPHSTTDLDMFRERSVINSPPVAVLIA